ncbi:unnamed protein product [Acanthoscelides obtectus]|uniref:MADF domain-containing protein n=1 Tax=Acanthoscelides obtectus TaxID=200917 RepID=A0A9P0KVZ6_ACAOB|nr:unnamed protein product [Acanthoscelides obtectus]CAK1643187.1 hypothetical protein AOBTE_LOCUS13439 [Acanthoscelides obtectus]
MNLQTFCVYMEPSYRSYAYSGSNAGPTLMGAIECKERWKNVRGRYTKYKNQSKLPSGSGAKHIKEYYLASHLRFLDSFVRSRPSKSNIKSTQEEA